MDIDAILIRHFPRMLHWLGRLTGANREAEMALLDILCDGDRPSIDVGAKTGMYSFRLLKHSGGVIAFEPNPDLAGLLRAEFRAKIEIHQIALSDKEGMADLRLPVTATGGTKAGRGTIEDANSLDILGGAARRFQVATRRLDDMPPEDVGFIKIDVEGHEMAVLAGAGKTIARCRPNMLVEANDAHAPNAVGRLVDWAATNDYWFGFLAGNALHQMGAADPGEIENFILLPSAQSSLICDSIRARLAGN